MLWFSQVFENINIADRNYITEMEFLKLVFTCQNHRSKHLNFHYIYPISYKIAKKANPLKWICPIENDITGSEPTVKILDT